MIITTMVTHNGEEYGTQLDTATLSKAEILSASSFEKLWEIVGLSTMKKLQEEGALLPFRCVECGFVLIEEFLDDPKRDKNCLCNVGFEKLREHINGKKEEEKALKEV